MSSQNATKRLHNAHSGTPPDDPRNLLSASKNTAEPSLTLALPDALVESVAERAAALVLEQLAAPASPYMGVAEAADYLRCKPQRIYDLVSSRRLTKLKDGSRVLVLRAELDAYLGVAPALPPAAVSRTAARFAA
jgi:excisionase family DNA binding protein